MTFANKKEKNGGFKCSQKSCNSIKVNLKRRTIFKRGRKREQKRSQRVFHAHIFSGFSTPMDTEKVGHFQNFPIQLV